MTHPSPGNPALTRLLAGAHFAIVHTWCRSVLAEHHQGRYRHLSDDELYRRLRKAAHRLRYR